MGGAYGGVRDCIAIIHYDEGNLKPGGIRYAVKRLRNTDCGPQHGMQSALCAAMLAACGTKRKRKQTQPTERTLSVGGHPSILLSWRSVIHLL